MPDVKTALVLGVHSFADPHFRTGIQYIAEGLARRGLDVEYVSVPSSPLDVLGRDRFRRLIRVWGHMGRSPVTAPVPGLREFAFVSPLPVHAALVWCEAALQGIRIPAKGHFASRRFDLCVHDVGPTMAYLPLVQAKRYYLRLNDAPETQTSLPGVLVEGLRRRLRDGQYRRVWAVSDPLVEYGAAVAPATPVTCVPNGFDSGLFSGPVSRLKGRRAVYVGNRIGWLDVALLRETARLLPEWEIHCVGAGFRSERDSGNLKFLPPVAHEAVPAMLAGYDVGLLPYRDDPHMDCVHRPLKYYEYVAAGLGVACADVGGLRQGMGPWVRFGRTPQEFAHAVEAAVAAARTVADEERAAFLAENHWAARLEAMFGAVDGLDQRAPAAS